MELYKTNLNWDEHIDHINLQMLVFSADDKNISSVISDIENTDIGIESNTGEIILKVHFKEWLKKHCTGYKYVGIDNMVPYIYFEKKSDAFCYKLSFDKIEEVVIIKIDDNIIERAKKMFDQKGDNNELQN